MNEKIVIGSNSLVQVLKERNVLSEKGVTFISGSDREEFLSYRELYNRALVGLGHLQDLDIAPGSEIVLQLENSQRFIVAFWACILGGYIPVPLSIGKNDEHKKKLFAVWEQLKNPYLLGDENTLSTIRQYASENGYTDNYDQIETSFILQNQLFDSTTSGVCIDASEEDIAFIQFSSGSTGTPKGIILTHGNLLSNIRAIGSKGEYRSEDVLISWMPLTHDMGLIGFHLCPVYEGVHHLIMDTNLFIRRPALWLQKSSDHHASVLCSPNFGYRYTLKHFDRQLKNNLDLSGVRLIYNGAEPISEGLCHEFLEYFEDCGLSKHAMCPVYGLAEASLAVTMSDLKDPVKSIQVDRNHLNVGDPVIQSSSSPDTFSLVNVGKPVSDCALRIVDGGGLVAPAETVGHIHIKGKNVTFGYYQLPSDAFKDDGWFDTGDMGVLIEGDLYITGRSKDIIFINGQNYYPHDVEQVAQKVEHVELNKIAVTSHLNVRTQENEIIAFVFHRGKLSDFMPIVDDLKAIVNRQIGLDLNHVIPVKNIPRTTSGKLQRFKLLQQYLSGDFEDVISGLKELQRTKQDNGSYQSEFSDEIEKKIRNIWAKVLKTQQITASDHFLQVGGNSLKLAEVGMLIWREFQVELEIDVLYKNQTIPSLAEELKKSGQTKYVSIPWMDDQEYYPLSTAQKRLFFAWKLNQDSLAYNNPVAFVIHGQVSVSELNDAINTLIRRNDALRMSFGFTSDPFFQVAGPNGVLLRLEESRCAQEELDLVLKQSVVPFDLENPPLFRAKLLHVEGANPVLFLDFHHIILDGISVFNLVEDLFALCIGDRTSNKPIDFKDFVYWEEKRLISDNLQLQKQYWEHQLADKLPLLDLPTDFPRPPVFDTEGAKIAFQFDEATTEALRALAREYSCTPFVLMLSFYQLLLFKYSGQDEICIGIPVSGRNHPDLLKLYGMFVNNLVLQGHLTSDDSFVQFLDRTKTQVDQALQNQEYPFEMLLDNLDLRTDASRNPLFDTMFLYQNMGIPFRSSELEVSQHFFDPGFSKFDLSIEFFDHEQGALSYNIEYAKCLFQEETILRLNELFRNLVMRVIADPDIQLRQLPLISTDEFHKVSGEINDTTKDYNRSKPVSKLFREQALTNPTAIAILHGSHQLTYKELQILVKDRADLLIQQGVQSGMIVAIMMSRSIDLVATILAVLEVGVCYLPIDIDSPEQRIRYILSDSKAQFLLTNSAHKGQVEIEGIKTSDSSLKLINVDDPYLKNSESKEQSDLTIAIDQPAYIIYTSGTTGNPKGVMVGHDSLTNYIQWAAKTYVDERTSNFPLFSNIAFDLTVTSIFTPLVTGNSIVIFDEEPEVALEQIMQSGDVNVVKLTPSHLKIIKELSHGRITPNGNIRKLIVGGESLETSLAYEVSQIFGDDLIIFNEYGPTEATVGCMIHQFDFESPATTVPIGRPIQNTRVYVLDKDLNPVPVGVKGELYVAGDGLAKGYLYRETLTDEKFIDNPFDENQLMYKTGDLVKILPSGLLEFMGRMDDQLKIRGYRVELSEISNCLKGIEGIDDALIIQKETDGGQLMLVGYYVGDPVTEPEATTEKAITGHLMNYLPDYMIPRHFIQVEAFPLTKNGKVDPSALPQPVLQQGYLAPTNEIEKVLIEVWNQVFDREGIGINDNFFDLGGDSIKAVQIASRLFERGIEVKARNILRFHTIDQIAQHTEVAKLDRYDQSPLTGARDLTPIEHWFFAQNFENPHFFNQSVLLDFHQPVNVSWVNRTFQMLIEHHDNLRCYYESDQRKAFYNNRLIGKELSVSVFNITEESQTLEEACQKLKSSFDITEGPLLKVGLIYNGQKQHLLLTAHHLLVDGISWRILLEDFHHCYVALAKGDQPALPAKTASSQLFVDELKQRKSEQPSENAFWESLDHDDFSIAQDHDMEHARLDSLQKRTVEFDPELTDFMLTEAYKKYNTNILTLLTTGLTLALQAWTKQDEFVIEFENHGRHLEQVDTSRTVAWFTAMYPVKLAIDTDSMTDLILSIKKQLNNIPDEGLGYGVYKFLSASDADSRPDPVLRPSEVRFNYLGHFGAELANELYSFSELSSGADIARENSMTSKLELNMMIINDILKLEVNYSSILFEEASIAHFCQLFKEEMIRLVDHIRSDEDIHFTPGDFDAVELDDDLLTSLFN